MPCGDCEKKLGGVACPDPWKEGARMDARKVGKNMAISAKKRVGPYDAQCKTCKSRVGKGAQYCQPCAYKKGVCSMCGKKILDTKVYKQST